MKTEAYDVLDLLHMLSYKRPHGSESEAEFIKQFLPEKCTKDKGGNYHYVIPADEANSPRHVFVAHVDTVHRESGRQHVVMDNKYVIQLDDEKSNCLGADDGTGVWILLMLIKAGVPGRYLFTRGEECGGIGSRWLADNSPEYFKNIDLAISFDRKGHDEVIREQGAGVCASKECAEALAKQINQNGTGLSYAAKGRGTFTDTSVFRTLVPECFNLGVGYMYQHGPRETQDALHLIELTQALIEVKWSELPIVRDPTPQVKPLVLGKSAKKPSDKEWNGYYIDGSLGDLFQEAKAGSDVRFLNPDIKEWIDVIKHSPVALAILLADNLGPVGTSDLFDYGDLAIDLESVLFREAIPCEEIDADCNAIDTETTEEGFEDEDPYGNIQGDEGSIHDALPLEFGERFNTSQKKH